jgi:hypothetical protein
LAKEEIQEDGGVKVDVKAPRDISSDFDFHLRLVDPL